MPPDGPRRAYLEYIEVRKRIRIMSARNRVQRGGLPHKERPLPLISRVQVRSSFGFEEERSTQSEDRSGVTFRQAQGLKCAERREVPRFLVR